MARFLIAYPADASIGGQEITTLIGSLKTPECFPQLKTTVLPQIFASFINVRPAIVRKSVSSDKRALNLRGSTAHQDRSNALDRTQPHSRAGARREDAESQFFKEQLRGTRPPYSRELSKSVSDFSALSDVDSLKLSYGQAGCFLGTWQTRQL